MAYTEAVVTVRDLHRAFAGRPVLDGVDLDITQGSVTALLGVNGAGKSTLVRILATLLRADAGSVVIAGHDLGRDPGSVRRAVSLTGQDCAVDDVLTGRENLQMMARLRHLDRRTASRRATELLREFDLVEAADRRVGTYSGGMRRRLDLAASMVERPQVLFLDEPTTGLDPRSRALLWETIRGLAADGVTILLTTQYLEEADALADAVVVLDHGRIVARGTPDQLKARLGREVLALRFADDAAYERARGLLEVRRCDGQTHTLEVATDGAASTLSELLTRLSAAGAPVERVSTHRATLDDVFLSLTSGTASQARAADRTLELQP